MIPESRTTAKAAGDGRTRRRRIFLVAPSSRLDVLALALSIAVFVLGASFGSRTAGGSDSYGYISQADLWLHGRLQVAQDWTARFAAWPDADAVFAPLAYKPGTTPHTIVPTYPPGLPLLMAAASLVGGRAARFLVAPLLGALAVWLTWRVGRRVVGGSGGLLAALLLAASPAFLFQVMQPMTDVPVTAAWLVATALMVRTPPRALLAGLAAAAALLIRPNLAPLAIVLALVPWFGGAERIEGEGAVPRVRRSLLFAAGVLPGVLFYAAFNTILNGSPLRTGYGNAGDVFSIAGSAGTLLHYLRQLVDTQTVFILLAALGCLVAGKRLAESDAAGTETSRALRVVLPATIVVVLGIYAFFLRFDEWTYLRFLLPAYPAMMVLSVAGLQWIAGALSKAGGTGRGAQPARLAVGAICLVVAAVTFNNAVRLGLFNIARVESRYQRVAERVARLTPPNAAILSMQHSGTARYYAARVTVRYDLLDPRWLDRAVKDLRDAGYRPYLLLEDWEVEAFRRRFGKLSATGELDRSPIVRLWSQPAVFLYDAQDASLPPQSSAGR